MASEPRDAYPARIGRLLGVDAINLGLGGGAHLEPEMADYIGGRDDWDFASLEMGINLFGGNRTTEEVRARVAGFLPRLAARRPERWIFCTDLFTCIHDVGGNPRSAEYRRSGREAVKAIGSRAWCTSTAGSCSRNPRPVGRPAASDIRGIRRDRGAVRRRHEGGMPGLG